MQRGVYCIVLILAVVAVAAIAILPKGSESPGETETLHWYKGNTHTHTLWSDGNDFPDMIVGWYKERGYDFLALSDHNVLSRGEKWMKVEAVDKRKKKPGASALEKYREKFGEEWVETRGEGKGEEVRLKTLKELRPKFEKEGEFLMIEAEEITDRFRNHEVHINALNLGELIPPQHGASVVETIRNNLRAAAEQAEKLGRPIITHLNHPNFRWSLTAQDLAEVVEEQFFEVYNGHPGINHLGDGTRPGDEQLWDIANTIRLTKLKARPLFGVATDDSHYYHGGDVSPGRGWIMVRAGRLEVGALIEAMKRGNFYASSGVELKDFSLRKGTYALRITPREGVTYSTRFVGTLKGDGAVPGEVLATVEGLEPAYTLTGNELYVRAVVSSSKAHWNPSFKDQVEQAWTQPVGWE